MTDPARVDEVASLEALLASALAWADWCAGEGIGRAGGPVEGNPEEFLYAYASATNDDETETYAKRLVPALFARLRAVEAERDEARQAVHIRDVALAEANNEIYDQVRKRGLEEARVAALEEGLRPFAAWGEHLDCPALYGDLGDDAAMYGSVRVSDGGSISIVAGDLRRARALLQEVKHD